MSTRRAAQTQIGATRVISAVSNRLYLRVEGQVSNGTRTFLILLACILMPQLPAQITIAHQLVLANGNVLHPNTSESYSYGQNQASKVGTMSRENMVGNAPPRDTMAVVRGMGMYDGDHVQRVERDDDGHGRRRGFWSILCCRA
jgi:hypothetical protein